MNHNICVPKKAFFFFTIILILLFPSSVRSYILVTTSIDVVASKNASKFQLFFHGFTLYK